ncbi:hypothetical protein H6776_00280 [Candidatus Nomurabacteria bacterium]|nr:hypothetical protein [Candidatus Nomurabacteria bacterium]
MEKLKPKAYILDWTVNDYSSLLEILTEQAIDFDIEQGTRNLIVNIPFTQLDLFSRIIQQQLNSPVNYVDIQYPEMKLTVIIFKSEVFKIKTEEQNKEIKKWAINNGLPVQQADWGVSF